MNENELRQALAGHAATVAPVADLGRLEAGMVRVDRMRTIRTACASAAIGAVTIFGAMSLSGDAESTSVDVVDAPDIAPTPKTDLPLIGDADTDETEGGADNAERAVVPDTTTTAVPVTEGRPDHLAASNTTAPTTSTTAPPAPTTTVAPTTTAAAPTTTTTPTTTTQAPPIDFTAAARYGSCAEDPPYDEYSGTAEPGTVITITSAHNPPAQVTADAEGSWFLRVEFSDAPANVYFTVTVTDGIDDVAFDFVHTV